MTTTTTVAMMAAVDESELESSDGSLRDTVTGDENSPPPTAVTACTCMSKEDRSTNNITKWRMDLDVYCIHCDQFSC